MLTAAVSGSFRRHMDAISAAIQELAALSVRVLSPADPRVVAAQGEFLFVASDRTRSIRIAEDRHFESIRVAHFLWLVCPDGEVGRSSSLELGYAIASGVPIFATRAPNDLTLQQYVKVVPSLGVALTMVRARPRVAPHDGILVDVHTSVEEAHRALDEVRTALTTASSPEPAEDIYRRVSSLQRTLALPTYAH